MAYSVLVLASSVARHSAFLENWITKSSSDLPLRSGSVAEPGDFLETGLGGSTPPSELVTVMRFKFKRHCHAALLCSVFLSRISSFFVSRDRNVHDRKYSCPGGSYVRY